MASRAKVRKCTTDDKRPLEGSECSSADESSVSEGWSDSEDSSRCSQTEIDVDFDVRAIEDTDFHGIRRLLQQSFLKASVDLSGLTQLIVSQKDVGSTIKLLVEKEEEEMEEGEKEEGKGGESSNEDEVYGISAVLSLSQYKDTVCVRGLVDFLLSQCQCHAPSTLPRLTELLQDYSQLTSLLVNERFLNIPPSISPPLLRSTISEVREACSKAQLPLPHHYLLVVRSHEVTVAKATTGKKRRRKGKAAASEEDPLVNGARHNDLVFDYFENEIFQKEACLQFSYPVEGESDSVLGGQWGFDDAAMTPWRTVLVLPATRLEYSLTELDRALDS